MSIKTKIIALISDIDSDSIQGAEFFMALWEDVRTELRKPDNVSALILNNADMRSTLPMQLHAYCRETEELKGLVMNTIIPANIQAKNVKLKHQPINILEVEKSNEKEAKEKLLTAYRNVVLELKERMVF